MNKRKCCSTTCKGGRGKTTGERDDQAREKKN